MLPGVIPYSDTPHPIDWPLSYARMHSACAPKAVYIRNVRTESNWRQGCMPFDRAVRKRCALQSDINATMAMNNMHVLLGGVDGRVRVLHPTTGQVIRTLTRHTGEIASIQYCSGANMFITDSMDGDKAVLGWRPLVTGGQPTNQL